jgi:nitrate/nitrite-specific signal transduction histidine kinase
MGFSGLFYINPDVLPLDGILAHVIQAIGLIFLVFGINKLVLYTRYLRFKDELVAHLCLVLIMFYVVFITTISVLLHIEFPPISAYIFIEFILLFQFIVYLLINKVNQPITNIIDSLDNYSPGKESVEIPIIRNDELGMLSEKINAVSKLSFQKILEVSKMAERNRSIIRIFESIQRVSNQDIIKNSIVEEIKNALNPDRIAIALYNKAEDSFYYDKYIENLPSQTLMDFEGKNPETKMIQRLNDFLKNSLELCYSNLDDYITSNSLQGTQREKVLRIYGIKSCCNIPIYFAGNLLGCLLIQYTKESITFDETDLNYLKTMATQLGVIINTQR